MKTAEEIVAHLHLSSQEPIEGWLPDKPGLIGLEDGIRFAQADAYQQGFADAREASAECAEAYAMTGVPVAEAIRALVPECQAMHPLHHVKCRLPLWHEGDHR